MGNHGAAGVSSERRRSSCSSFFMKMLLKISSAKCQLFCSYPIFYLQFVLTMLMVHPSTAVTPMLMYWGYCSQALTTKIEKITGINYLAHLAISLSPSGLLDPGPIKDNALKGGSITAVSSHWLKDSWWGKHMETLSALSGFNLSSIPYTSFAYSVWLIYVSGTNRICYT